MEFSRERRNGTGRYITRAWLGVPSCGKSFSQSHRIRYQAIGLSSLPAGSLKLRWFQLRRVEHSQNRVRSATTGLHPSLLATVPGAR